jgi:hypothetical protein
METDQLRAAALTAVSGPCVLDASARTILNYAQGSLSLIEVDAGLLAPSHRSAALAAVAGAGVPEAFAVRRQLISFKKVCLNVFDAAQLVEKDLQQLATFHYYQCPKDGSSGELQHTEPYTLASKLLQNCRGSLSSIHGVRQITKLICSIPRHPDSARLPPLVAVLRPGGAARMAVGRSV